tara:strand:+ start:1027 stop:2433 length:1407 start_codon:yes stop_codon:yes gene_type:complete
MSTKNPHLVEGTRSWSWYLKYVSNPFACLNRVSKEHGNVLALGNPVPFGGRGRRYVMAFGEGANRDVFSQPDLFIPGGQVLKGPKGSAQRRLRGGLLAMHGDKHRSHRKAMQPPFSKLSVASYVPTITKLIDQVFDRWVIGEAFDMYEETTTMANWIAAHILFDHEDFDRSVETCELITRWIDLDVKARSFPLPYCHFGTPFAKLLDHAEVLEKAMLNLISEKRKEEIPGNDVLSVLVQASKEEGADISDIDLTAHAVILHTAAFITTASSLAWTMYLIAQNPKFAAELDAEIKANITDWPPDPKQVEKLPLLDGLIRESLRLMPPVHHTIRTATAETELLNVTLRKGDRVVVSAYMTHRDPTLFENPEQFDPKRWIDKKAGPFQYTPFSAGPRLCIGYQFAMLEMKLIVVRMMQRFRLSVVANSSIEADCQLTLRPTKGMPMVVNKPEGAFVANPVTGNINDLIQLE